MAGPRTRRFSPERLAFIDYKDVELLKRFITDRGKIISRRQSGITASEQRRLTIAIKRARHVALLPFTAESVR
jgi:small subunit ribosomal protein S18